MTDAQMHPVYILIDYTYKLLNANFGEVWDKSKYGGLTPILPLADQPEIEEYGGARIIYEFSTSPSKPDYWNTNGTTTFAVIAPSLRIMSKTMNILQTAFERFDESAKDVNEYAKYLYTYPLHEGMGFSEIHVQFASQGDATESEGGPHIGVINLTWKASVDYDVTTSFTSL
jgi:hypothetical protein